MYHEARHSYSHFANEELLWCPSDTEDLYRKHLETRKLDLEKYNWLNSNFTYKFNSFGFRSEEFCKSDNMLTLGCSHATGIGLPIEHTWAHIVSNRLGLKNFNLSIAGGSNGSSFRMAHNWIHQLKPKIVVLMITHAARLEIVSDHYIDLYSSAYHNDHNDKLWNQWIMNDVNLDTDVTKNTMAIQYLCHAQNIKLIITKFIVDDNLIDFARDLMHPGIETNKICAEKINNLIDGAPNPVTTCPHYNSVYSKTSTF